MEERVLKLTKVITKRRMVFVALDSGEDVEETFGHGERQDDETFSVCGAFVAQYSSRIEGINDIYQHVHDPAQDN